MGIQSLPPTFDNKNSRTPGLVDRWSATDARPDLQHRKRERERERERKVSDMKYFCNCWQFGDTRRSRNHSISRGESHNIKSP